MSAKYLKYILGAALFVCLCVQPVHATSQQNSFDSDFEAFTTKINGEFEDFSTKINSNIIDFSKEIKAEYKSFCETTTIEYERFRHEINQKWQDFKASSTTTWVNYGEDFSVRSSVNFEEGYIEVEVVVEDDSPEAQREAIEKIKRQLALVAMACQDQAGIDILPELDNGPEVSVVPNRPAKREPEPAPKHEPKPAPKPEPKPAPAPKPEPKLEPKHEPAPEQPPKPSNVLKTKFNLPSEYLNQSAAKFQGLIHQNAKMFGLSTEIVYAIIHTESYFNPFARSPIPAFGLMQLVANTGGRDAYQYVYKKDIKPTEEYLYDPENNVLLGTAYFSKIKNVYFKGVKNQRSAYMISIAAYNTGIGNVALAFTGTKSLKNVAKVVNSMTPEEVRALLQKKLPYDETKKYVEHVLTRSELYRGL